MNLPVRAARVFKVPAATAVSTISAIEREDFIAKRDIGAKALQLNNTAIKTMKDSIMIVCNKPIRINYEKSCILDCRQRVFRIFCNNNKFQESTQ